MIRQEILAKYFAAKKIEMKGEFHSIFAENLRRNSPIILLNGNPPWILLLRHEIFHLKFIASKPKQIKVTQLYL